jgi:hypothetical protein
MDLHPGQYDRMGTSIGGDRLLNEALNQAIKIGAVKVAALLGIFWKPYIGQAVQHSP